MANENNGQFDADYVKKLRDEAAQWRTKCRELEGQVAFTQIDAELNKRGIKADPRWVEVEEGKSISEAVDALVEKHPHLKATEPVVQETQTETTVKTTGSPSVRPMPPKPLVSPQTNTNAPGTSASGVLKDRSFGEIKKDPVARAKLRDLYRSLINQSSNQGNIPE